MANHEKVRATVRVVADQGASGPQSRVPRPSGEAIHKAARVLSDLGFRVVRCLRFGVEVEGTAEQFRRVLRVDIGETNGFVSPVTDPIQSLKQLVDFVEVVPEPNYYAR